MYQIYIRPAGFAYKSNCLPTIRSQAAAHGTPRRLLVVQRSALRILARAKQFARSGRTSLRSVRPAGFEPATLSLKGSCSTN